MGISLDFLHNAEQRIYALLQELRPELLAAYGTTSYDLKEDTSLVTSFDIMVENRLREVCAQLDPTFGFSGEESGVDYGRETFWLVDPIDGTEAFVRGLPFCTNMVALIHQGEPILAVIYNFVTDEYCTAIKGKGAKCNRKPIQVSTRPLKRSYILLNGLKHIPKFPHMLRQRIGGLPKFHASGAEAICVAQGKFDGKIAQGSKGAWDFAAGCLLIQEAGGRVENFNSKEYDYRDLHFVAANPVIFDELKQLAEDAEAVQA